MKYLQNTKEALKEVYSHKSYFFLSLFTGFIIFSFNVTINNYKLILSNFSPRLFFSLLSGAFVTMSTTSLVLLIIMSVLAGIVTAMSVFLIKRQIKGSAAGSSSVLVGIIAPSCPSCAVGLLSVLGLGGFIGFLPFKGAELGIIGISIMLISLVYLSKKVVTKTCKIKNEMPTL